MGKFSLHVGRETMGLRDSETAGLRAEQIPEVPCPEVKRYCSLILNSYLYHFAIEGKVKILSP